MRRQVCTSVAIVKEILQLRKHRLWHNTADPYIVQGIDINASSQKLNSHL